MGAALILVGTKQDLRHDKKTLKDIGGPEHLVSSVEVCLVIIMIIIMTVVVVAAADYCFRGTL